MNIQEAKQEIKDAMTAYFSKNEFGEYEIPVQKQRPIFLMGPPGIGKTAVMEQVAQELGVGLVSYSMTHHTRQSALGLPFIEKKLYGGKEYSVSEYTMSEIIASVYDLMEVTGIKEGILFLDEINCVSETLAPSMLQFLQYKIFGRHRVPEGWIVVTAGNPPEYNNSVREFDIVTWDRLKRIDVEPDYSAWKEYALNSGVHPAITTYLDINKGDFYKIETTVDGKEFATARGWSDLSDMIKLYEKNSISVKKKLISQYLQNENIAKKFAIYYDLFNKYKSDYQIDNILSGKVDNVIKGRAKDAKFDERLSLLGMILDMTTSEMRDVNLEEMTLLEIVESLKKNKSKLNVPGGEGAEVLNEWKETKKKDTENKRVAGTISNTDLYVANKVMAAYDQQMELLGQNPDKNSFELLKEDYLKRVDRLKKLSKTAGDRLTNAFTFLEDVFGDGQEMLIFVTELTVNKFGAKFISRYGCEKYFKHNKDLLLHDRQKEILAELDKLDLP